MRRQLWATVPAVAAVAFGASVALAGNVGITNVNVQSYETTTLSGFVNQSPITTLIELTTTGGSILPVFCVDLLHDINIGGYSPPLPYFTSPVATDSTGAHPGTGNALPDPPIPGEIQALANLGAYDFHHGVSDADVYTALQGAIWYLEYNTNGNLLTVTGDSTVGTVIGGDPSSATGLLATDLAYAVAHATDYSVGLYPGSTGQGFVGYGQGFASGVPELSTWAMMLSGFAGLGLVGYRRARSRIAVV